MDELRKGVERTISLYKNGWFNRVFARIRFWDAPYLEVEKMVPVVGKIVDLGCGEGIFANYLAVKSSKREVIGIEIDNKRAKAAYQGLPNTHFFCGDVTKEEIPKAQTIVLVHLLHHLDSYTAQEKLIKRCWDKLAKNGKMVIVEVEPKLSFKYLATWFTDHFLVPWIFERRFYSSIFFRKGTEWRKVLDENGFSCEIISAEKSHPFTHIILKCQKK